MSVGKRGYLLNVIEENDRNSRESRYRIRYGAGNRHFMVGKTLHPVGDRSWLLFLALCDLLRLDTGKVNDENPVVGERSQDV